MKTLVLGASENVERYSNKAIKMLNRYQHDVCAIGHKKGIVDGVDFDKEKILFEKVDTVTLYLNPKNQEAFYEYILKIHPRRLIFNPGTENETLYKMASEKGIICQEACTLVLLSTNQY